MIKQFSLGVLTALVVFGAARAADVATPGTCTAIYNRLRHNCTITHGQCAAGYIPFAHPPDCDCTCQRLGRRQSHKKT